MDGIPVKSTFGERLAPAVKVPQYDETEGKYFDRSELNLAPCQWGMIALNQFKATSITMPLLPSGVYEINKDEHDGKSVFIKKTVVHDKLIPLKGLPKQVIDEIRDFWGKESLFKSLGFLHRRGYLFYGSHGTGKSSLVHEIVDGVLSNQGIVFYCDNPHLFNEGLSMFRKVEPNRKIVCVFEDIDAIIKRHGEALILSILDGENQISGVCNLATTNYPELLDKRIVGRPRRFDRVYRIGNLDDEARLAYLKAKLPKGEDPKIWLKQTQGLSIAQISEIIISVLCLGVPMKQAVEIVTELAQDKASSDGDEPIGFTNMIDE